jgi:single-stranded-DNA-specific exonuclease
MAAGLSLAAADLERFRAAFAAEIAARADAHTLTGVVHSDGELDAGELSVDTARLLRAGGPWGQGFPEPIFDGIFKIRELRVVGGKHLKLRLEPAHAPSPRGIDAIAFSYLGGATEDGSLRPGTAVQVAYRLEVNEFRGAESVQLNCQHLKAL